MGNTIGYHFVKSAYGLWLPGDERGSWSDAWDDQIGYCEPHTLHGGDPVRLRMAEERLKHPPVRFTQDMIAAIADAVGQCVRSANGGLVVAAMAIETTHMHLALGYTGRDIDTTGKWIADQTTKAVHRTTSHAGPVWCKGRWRSFVYDQAVWGNVLRYIRQHNIRRGMPADPYPL